MNWREFAACRGMNTEIFFLDDSNRYKKQVYAEAKSICAVCPVRVSCLDDAMAHHHDYGVFGGMAPHERRDLARYRRLEERFQSA